MACRRRAVEQLSAIWRGPDERWDILQPMIVKHDPPQATGRPPIDARAAVDPYHPTDLKYTDCPETSRTTFIDEQKVSLLLPFPVALDLQMEQLRSGCP